MIVLDSVREPSPPSSSRVRAVLAVLTVATFLTVTAEMSPSGLLASMARDLDVSEGAVGLLVGAWAVTIAVVGIPLVRRTARVARVVLLPLSLGVTAVANLLVALAPHYAAALAGRVVAAAAHGLFWAIVVSYVAALVDPRRLGRALAVVLAGPTLAGLVGLPVVVLLADHLGWRLALGGLATSLGVVAVVLRGVLPARGAESGEASAGGWDRSGRVVVLVAAAGGLVLVGHFATFTYVTILFVDVGGFHRATIPVLLAVTGLAGGVGVAAAGTLSDRLPRSGLLVTACLVTVGLGLVVVAGDRPVLFVAGLVLWGAAVGAFAPVLQTTVLRVSSAGARTLAGAVVVTALNLGVAAGATLGALVVALGAEAPARAGVVAALAGTTAIGALRTRPSWNGIVDGVGR